MIKIGIDAMGGDDAPEITVKGSMDAIKRFNDIELVLYGDESKIKKYLTDSTRISIVHTEKFLDMGEHNPVLSFRKDPDTSLALALKAGANKEVDAVVSAGPTQALVVGSHMLVKKIPEMKRVALAPILPSADGKGRILLDVGANTELKPEHYLEFARYAMIIAKEIMGVNDPKVGLLNIGTEEGKGRELDQEAYKLLKEELKDSFKGNIEPKELMFTDCDIMLSDGFTGNMVIKTFEGTAKACGYFIKKEIKSSLMAKIGALFMKKALKNFKKRFDSSEIGGAMICGVKIPVVKAHGSSDQFAYMNAIRQARSLVEKDVINKVSIALKEK